MSVATVAAHPILGAVATARAALGEVVEVQPVFMSTAEKQAALVELARLEAQATEARLGCSPPPMRWGTHRAPRTPRRGSRSPPRPIR